MTVADLRASLPPEDGDAPLQEMVRDHLSVFLFTALTGPELTTIIRDLKISLPGYRIEKLSDSEKADILADEIRAYPDARKPVIDALRKAYEYPALDGVALPATVAQEIANVSVELDAMPRLLWRVLADPSAEVRKSAAKALDALVKIYYGSGDAPKRETKKKAAGEDKSSEREIARLRKDLEKATDEAARAREAREELKKELAAYRSQVGAAEKDYARSKKAEAELAKKLDALEQDLAKAKTKTGKRELDRAKKDAASAESRIAAIEDREKAARAEADELRVELATLRKSLANAPRPAAPVEEEASPDEGVSQWAIPRFTREFYDSIEKWDALIQRLAFEKSLLLAKDHRHPSLRAIPLEGLAGYFRVRIASDVRLIYKRGDDGVQILSLIDREDLDRYVRQAKTR